MLLSLETNEQTVLVDGTAATFVPPGHLVFARADSLWAAVVRSFYIRRVGPQPRVASSFYSRSTGTMR